MRNQTQSSYQPMGTTSPPPYETSPEKYSSEPSRWNPLHWRLRTWLIAGAVFIIILIAVVVGAVEGVQANAYPDYSALNYSLVDSCKLPISDVQKWENVLIERVDEGEGFWTDNFDYFTGYDPTSGFVQYVSAL
jgi:hypothetical protein